MCRVAEALFGVTPAAHRVCGGAGRAARGPAPPPAGAGAPCTGLRRGTAPPAVRARVSVYVCAEATEGHKSFSFVFFYCLLVAGKS